MLDDPVAAGDHFLLVELAAEAAGQGPGWQVEHRYRAVMEVLDGSPVSEVAVLYGVSRHSVYSWRDRYAAGRRVRHHREADRPVLADHDREALAPDAAPRVPGRGRPAARTPPSSPGEKPPNGQTRNRKQHLTG